MNLSWDGWKPTEEASLLFLFDDRQVLLIRKKRGLGQGKINAPGGRLEKGETFAQAAIRETYEETGLQVDQLVETATLSFAFADGYGLFVKVFFAYSFSGIPRETDEADPFWHPADQIPFEKMWADDPLWLPHALEGKYVTGRFHFDGDRMLTQEVGISPRNNPGSP